MTTEYTRTRLFANLIERGYQADALDTITRWLDRGDGAAIYENQDLGHPDTGHTRLVSYGSPDAQLETDEPPTRLPDIGTEINWRYQLIGTCRERNDDR